jgi:hypothetical protein
VYTATITQTTTNLLGALNCTFGQLPQVNTFAGLYDMYRIDYCEFTFKPRVTGWSMVQGATVAPIPTPPTIFTVVDKDTSNTPASLSALQEYQTVEEHKYKNFTHRFKPGTLGGIWDGANLAPGRTQISPWVDMAQTSIPHYGILYGVTAGVATTLAQVWDVSLYIGFSCKCVR